MYSSRLEKLREPTPITPMTVTSADEIATHSDAGTAATREDVANRDEGDICEAREKDDAVHGSDHSGASVAPVTNINGVFPAPPAAPPLRAPPSVRAAAAVHPM